MSSTKVSEKTTDVLDKKTLDKAPFVSDKTQDYIRIALLSSLGLYLRIMKLGYPPFITDIELETTRQVNWYMSGKFFIGKFPPLTAIISAGLARLVGYYGTEDLLYGGQPFVEFPVVALRRLSAILGASLIPLCYLTLRNMGHAYSTATLAAALLIFENGIVTQSRFATPDIYVLFFGAVAIFAWNRRHPSLVWQLVSGVSMGCAASSKWTGALMLPVIWSSIVMEAWHKLCTKQNSVKWVFHKTLIHLFAAGIVPLVVYSTIFLFHFNLVPSAGDHDLLVSSRLKYSLQGNEVEPSQPNVAFGSRIVMKHVGTVGGYLHSHDRRFTGGSTQQEVTLYPYIDVNNIWTVHKNAIVWNDTQPIEFVRNGDQIRLEHFPSTRKLHSHDHRPQLSNKPEHNEVSAYGDRLILDSHDYWNLQILNEDGTPSDDKTLTWKPLTQQFRLQHIRGCMLISHNAWYFPPMGDGHQEVTCMASAGNHLTSWQVESTYHEQLEGMKMITYEEISTLEKFMEVHGLMSQYPSAVHNRLQTSSVDDGSANPQLYTEETPTRWFFKKSSEKIWNELSGFSAHLILNPALQKMITGAFVFYLGISGTYYFLLQRQCKPPQWVTSLMNEFYSHSIFTFGGALLIPSLLVSFLPSHTTSMADILLVMYYGASTFSVILESSLVNFHVMFRRFVFYGVLCLCVVQFSQLSRLAYGGEKWFRAQCEGSSLDIDCIRFPPAPTDLLEFISNSGSTQNSTLLTIYVELAGGTTQPFRYNQGQEEEADRHIAMLKHNSFLQEASKTHSVFRYHRALPTPALTIEDAVKWAQEVNEQAQYRQTENDRKLQESIERAHKMKEEKEEQKQLLLEQQEQV